MNWVEELKYTDTNWNPIYFRRNSCYYNLTVYLFLALSKGIVGDYQGVALQIRRLLTACIQLKEDGLLSECSNYFLITDFVSKFRAEYSTEYTSENLDNWFNRL